MRLNSTAVRRSQSTVAERVRWVLEFQRSGKTQRAFAPEHGLKLATLQKWIAQQRQSSGSIPTPGWASPSLRAVPLAAVLGHGPWAVEIALPGHAVVRLKQSLSASELRHVIGSLRA